MGKSSRVRLSRKTTAPETIIPPTELAPTPSDLTGVSLFHHYNHFSWIVQKKMCV